MRASRFVFFLFAATSRASMQRQELNVQGAQGDKAPLAP
jgi:hypothetical protein